MKLIRAVALNNDFTVFIPFWNTIVREYVFQCGYCVSNIVLYFWSRTPKNQTLWLSLAIQTFDRAIMKLMTLGFRSRNEDIDTTKHHPKKADLSENFLQHCIFFICGHWAKQLSSAVLNTVVKFQKYTLYFMIGRWSKFAWIEREHDFAFRHLCEPWSLWITN